MRVRVWESSKRNDHFWEKHPRRSYAGVSVRDPGDKRSIRGEKPMRNLVTRAIRRDKTSLNRRTYMYGQQGRCIVSKDAGT